MSPVSAAGLLSPQRQLLGGECYLLLLLLLLLLATSRASDVTLSALVPLVLLALVPGTTDYVVLALASGAS
jgi:hypothetical protein